MKFIAQQDSRLFLMYNSVSVGNVLIYAQVYICITLKNHRTYEKPESYWETIVVVTLFFGKLENIVGELT